MISTAMWRGAKMSKVLEVDELGIKVGAYKLPNRKKIAICTETDACIKVHGYFNSEEDADTFMNTIAYIIGLDEVAYEE